MNLWAIADLHLSFGISNKEMDPFGDHWHNHFEKISRNWREQIKPTDLILIAGDISWAMTPDDAKADLEWIDSLPGTKVLIRGNHDFWWTSLNKVAKILPPSIKLIQNNAISWNGVSIAGARLWDTHEYQFNAYIDYRENPKANKLLTASKPDDEKIFTRELQRLETSLKGLDQRAAIKIAMTHYPPIGADLTPSRTAELLKKYHVDICIFGHLHNLKPNRDLFGQSTMGICYILTSCDYLNFMPIKIADLSFAKPS